MDINGKKNKLISNYYCFCEKENDIRGNLTKISFFYFSERIDKKINVLKINVKVRYKTPERVVEINYDCLNIKKCKNLITNKNVFLMSKENMSFLNYVYEKVEEQTRDDIKNMVFPYGKKYLNEKNENKLLKLKNFCEILEKNDDMILIDWNLYKNINGSFFKEVINEDKKTRLKKELEKIIKLGNAKEEKRLKI